MSAKDLIDAVRKAFIAEGFEMKLQVGRDHIAKVFFGKSYSAVIAAERAGKLAPPRIIEVGLRDIQARYGVHKREVIARLSQVFLENLNSSPLQGKVMKATEQIAAGLIPALPQLTWEMIQKESAEQKRQQKEIMAITLNPMNWRQGKDFQCVKATTHWYALHDEVQSGVPTVTALWNGSVLYVHDVGDMEGDHEFLEWIFNGREWLLSVGVHMIIDEDEMDDTLDEIRRRWE